MILPEQTIPCPVCGNNISFDTRELLKGVKFTCSKCNAVIGLAEESKATVQDAMDKLDDLKGGISDPSIEM